MLEAAENLLGRIVALGEEYPDTWVPDDVLWSAANLSYEEYVDAADELVVGGSRRVRLTRVSFRFLEPHLKGEKGSDRSNSVCISIPARYKVFGPLRVILRDRGEDRGENTDDLVYLCDRSGCRWSWPLLGTG